MTIKATDAAADFADRCEGIHDDLPDSLLVFFRDEVSDLFGLLDLAVDDPLDGEEGEVLILFELLEKTEVSCIGALVLEEDLHIRASQHGREEFVGVCDGEW